LFVDSYEEYGEQLPAPAPTAAPEAPFIPPQAERPAMRAPRMPRIDELPIPAQNQIRARQSEGTEAAAGADKPKVSLLQRLASVGLGRREDEAAPRPVQQRPAPVTAERAPPPMPKAPPMPPLPRPQEPRGDTMSEYAKRPAPQRGAPQGLDQHGRPAPVNNAMDDDQLEIPAFLRRQAN
jgi:cell division protein FtsZ